tara:strand:- start:241 stop:720 length:480 start_codon:yes stop_codon:yes gene_type:complete
LPLVTNLISDNVDDLDNDPSTDQYINLFYFDMNANFPGKSLPTPLAEITFSTSTQEVDPITGEPVTTAVNFSSSERATGYEFLGESTKLTAQLFNLDVDGNGEVGAFSDGLMVIRHLFGTAFQGEALTDSAISNDSPHWDDQEPWIPVANNIDALMYLF